MADKKSYDEVGIAKIVSSNKGCQVNGKKIIVDDSKSCVGNGTWGKIDYLCKNHGYSYSVGKVEKFTHAKPKARKDNNNYQKGNKITDMNTLDKSKNSGFNMGSFVANAMRKV